ncbi:hypothetical protein [Flavobacterium noncentrifugens]|nr:hypothetical protein [Flavobacterium noncentrifugens]
MRKIILPIMFLAAGMAFYEQSKPQPDIYITVAGILLFLLGVMWYSSKTPSKNQDHDEDNVQ